MLNSTPRLRGLFFGAAALTGFSSLLGAQVRYDGAPSGPALPFAEHVPTLDLAAPDVAALRAANAANQAPGPLMYGTLIPATLDFTEFAAWDTNSDGMLVGRLRIAAPGAHSLGVEFDQYELPEDGQLFVYDEPHEDVYGAYNHQNRIPTGEFVVEPFPGDSVIIEYTQPARSAEFPTLVLRGVIYDYEGIFGIIDGLNQAQNGGGIAGGCVVNVNCPEGDPYELQKRATVRTLSGGGLCSGVLLNNTAQDGTQFLYTANHCGQGSGVNVRFNYQTANCGGGSAPTNQSVSGATLLDTDQDTDGRLMLITSPIPQNYNPYFSGWSRSAANLTFGMSMHHPGGGPKNISIDNNGGGSGTSGFIGLGNVKVWFMNFQIGGTSGGSSGGPLFDQNLRVRGTLTGGPANCANSQYGRFNPFWNDDNIGEHLDPLGLDPTTLDGLDPNNPTSPPSISSISPGTISAIQGGTMQITGTDLNAASSVQVGSQVFAPGKFQVVNSFLIELPNPLLEGLGSVPVTVTNALGTSNSVNVSVTDNDPPIMYSDPVSLPGIEWNMEWGGLSQDVYFVNWALDDSTIPLSGFDVLANGNFGVSGTASLGGTGEFVIPSPGSLGFLNLYFQVLMFDGGGAGFVGSSNITSSLFL